MCLAQARVAFAANDSSTMDACEWMLEALSKIACKAQTYGDSELIELVVTRSKLYKALVAALAWQRYTSFLNAHHAACACVRVL